MVEQEIIIEIDTTLDQLICNAEAIQNVNIHELSETELSSFQKTQESLLHHLLYMDEFLEKKRKTQHITSTKNQITEKRNRFAKLKNAYQNRLSQSNKYKSDIILKRRTKKFFRHI